MGGLGSGNHYYHWHRGRKKTTVEQCKSLDANRWTREGKLKADVHLSGTWVWTYPSGGRFVVNYSVNTLDMASPSVRLWYSWIWTATEQTDSADYTVQLTTTRPRFGGLRWWFRCPLVKNGIPCRRRVAKLYLPGAGRYFGCRRCHNLTYTSCQESHKDEAFLLRFAGELGTDLPTVKEVLKQMAERK